MISDFAPRMACRRQRSRRRAIFGGAVVAVAGSLLLGGNVYGSLTSRSPPPAPVGAGDTPWCIAARHSSTGVVRMNFFEIITLYHLCAGLISPC
jgi:hypothetical protein